MQPRVPLNCPTLTDAPHLEGLNLLTHSEPTPHPHAHGLVILMQEETLSKMLHALFARGSEKMGYARSAPGPRAERAKGKTWGGKTSSLEEPT